MNLTIDTTADSLGDVLSVVGAAYGVSLTTREPGDAASEVPAEPKQRSARRGRSRAPKRGARPDSAAVRAWAVEQGMPVSGRGALPKTVVDAFQAAH